MHLKNMFVLLGWNWYGSAKRYWESVLHDIDYSGQDPIIMLEKKKLRLTKK